MTRHRTGRGKKGSFLRVGRMLERSRASGPGERFVIWTQGCSIPCPACCGPDLRDPAGGESLTTRSIADRVRSVPGIRGVTLSGGEPLDQADAVADLLKRLGCGYGKGWGEPAKLDAVLFTGYSWEEVRADKRRFEAVRFVDLLVAGPFLPERASDDNPWAGSSNQTVHAVSGRIREDEPPGCRVEAQIGPDGRTFLTGFPPADLAGLLRSVE